MLAIRLSRIGAKKRPMYRVVVTDSTAARDSRFVESLGFYRPKERPAIVDVDRDRYDHWVKLGARPSDSVRTLIERHLTPKPAAPETTAIPAPPTPPPSAPPAPEAPAQ